MLSNERKWDIARRYLSSIVLSWPVFSQGFRAKTENVAKDTGIPFGELWGYLREIVDSAVALDKNEESEPDQAEKILRKGEVAFIVIRHLLIKQNGMDVNLEEIRELENSAKQLDITREEAVSFYLDMIAEVVHGLLSVKKKQDEEHASREEVVALLNRAFRVIAERSEARGPHRPIQTPPPSP